MTEQPIIKNQWGLPAQSRDINEMLGLGRKGKLPAEGMPPRAIQGIKVWVEPLDPNRPKNRHTKFRVKCECSNCYRVMSVGRLQQHVCP